MNTGARAAKTGPSVAGLADVGGPAADPGDAAGRLLGRLSVLPALVVTAWLLAGLPLLLAGHFSAAVMLVVSVPLAVVLVAARPRRVPAPLHAPRPHPHHHPPPPLPS